jgi:hypothetical protein
MSVKELLGVIKAAKTSHSLPRARVVRCHVSRWQASSGWSGWHSWEAPPVGFIGAFVRNLPLMFTAVAALSLAYLASVQAVPTTYQYTGHHFTEADGPYTTSMFVTAIVTLAGPLGAKEESAIGAADKNIVVEIPDRRLARTGVLKHVVGASAAVKVGHCYHRNRLREG